MTINAVLTFQFKAKQAMINRGGDSAWHVNPRRIRKHGIRFVVATRNRNDKRLEPGADEPHGAAFLIGEIADVVHSDQRADRYILKYARYAEIFVPEAWQKISRSRNPIQYFDLSEIVDPTTLSWRKLPDGGMATEPMRPTPPGPPPAEQVDVIAKAKAMIAAAYPNATAIDISLRF